MTLHLGHPDLEDESAALVQGDDTSSETPMLRRFRFGMLAIAMALIVTATVINFRSSIVELSSAAKDSTIQEFSTVDNRLQKLIHDLREAMSITKRMEAKEQKAQAAAKAVAAAKAASQPAQNVTKPAGPVKPKFDNTTKQLIWKDPFSFFCFMLVVPSELPMIQWQFKNGVGIFGCNNWAVYNSGSDSLKIGTYADGSAAKTTPLPGPDAFFGKSYFWGCSRPQKYLMNANVMVRAWEHAAGEGVAGMHSWIVKVDADSVFSPARLQRLFFQRGLDDVHLQHPRRYFKNCKAMNSMQGSVEILSRDAFYYFTGKKVQCQQKMDWWHMGEDIFTFHCMQQLGVPALDLDEGSIDSYCAKTKGCVDHPEGPKECTNANAAVFHPFKTLDKYKDCWKEMQEVDQRRVEIQPGLLY